MTEESRSVLPQEPESISRKRVLLVAAATAIIFAIGIAWAAHITRTGLGALSDTGPDPRHVAIGRPEIGIVEQAMYGRAESAQTRRARDRATLDGYGWVDRPHGVIRIPIDRAMELVIEQEGSR